MTRSLRAANCSVDNYIWVEDPSMTSVKEWSDDIKMSIKSDGPIDMIFILDCSAGFENTDMIVQACNENGLKYQLIQTNDAEEAAACIEEVISNDVAALGDNYTGEDLI